MSTIHHLFQVLVCSVLLVQIVISKANIEKVYLDKLCGNDQFILDGDNKPGIILYLTSSSKYKPNTNCTVKFRTAQISQRFVVTVEKMEIKDCPGDQLIIYDGPTVLNSDGKQKCGSPAPFTFTTTTTHLSVKFTSNAAVESSGFQLTIALHFPVIALCPQNQGFFQCKNKNCISKQLQCDGHDHCGDETDETQCGILSG